MKTWTIVLIAALLVSCSTTRWVPVKTAAEAARTLRPGDSVSVVMKDGRAFTATVRKITRESLLTVRNEYPLTQMESLTVERKETDVGRTTLLVAGVVALLGAFGKAFAESTAEGLAQP